MKTVLRGLTRASVLPVWVFCADLAERLEGGDHTVPGLAEAGAAYRADPLLEAAADLSDCLVSHERGEVDVSAVRHEALRVATLACRLWLVSLELTVENGAEEAGDGDD